MKKNRVRLTESQLHRVIKESVNDIISEGMFGNMMDGMAKNFGGQVNNGANAIQRTNNQYGMAMGSANNQNGGNKQGANPQAKQQIIGYLQNIIKQIQSL